MPHRKLNIAPLLVLLTLGLGLGGCLGSTATVPADHYYRFMVPAPGKATADKAFDGVLSVAIFEADGLLRDRPILFSSHRDPLTLRQHNYHFWVDPPARMIQREMIQYLRATGIARSVVAPTLETNPDFELIGRIKRLERVLGGGAPAISASIEIAVMRVSDRKVVLNKTYALDLRSGGNAVNEAVAALNKAVGRIFADFRDDAVQTHQTALR